jgi:FMN phosphatase YigB (HAD superfamily)
LNTDIKGASEYGIQNVWLSGPEYRSPDDRPTIESVNPDHVIARLEELPALVASLTARTR